MKAVIQYGRNIPSFCYEVAIPIWNRVMILMKVETLKGNKVTAHTICTHARTSGNNHNDDDFPFSYLFQTIIIHSQYSMPPRRKKPCELGADCPYQHEYQHSLEFSHGKNNEHHQSGGKRQKHQSQKATMDGWKRTAGHTLGGSDARGSNGVNSSSVTSTRGGMGRPTSAAAKRRASAQAAAKRATIYTATTRPPNNPNELKRPFTTHETNRESKRGGTKPSNNIKSSSRNGACPTESQNANSTTSTNDNNATSARKQWKCTACTLVNPSFCQTCSVCESKRPTHNNIYMPSNNNQKHQVSNVIDLIDSDSD
mmetsp:Transcript_3290/g.6071  ORF Transcript_3290/g.6071 Transcript_3290/m.6071 type:complete len:312 (-) Transcript_3290:207-1142(-)|eukprot:CAMPEP_0202489584 /NCGR_PEP_ID=MMETSP1361-20130828/7264_1 /ASSEMBLY_ACC=CAM_ASM_000849 /TAXON_ID=210615 /ORGANISM="Staurosira complex sp., Strain CCMP2646" /LENGTH=311 /DNA_ID=CAMNT_0049119347 /DNA_START=181 /DNA_END=1116 /DNA_ORIENTATION=-